MKPHIRGRGVAVRFLFDRHRRSVTPALQRLRRRGTSSWGLRGLDFDIASGAGVALIGRSGSGKTTLLRVLAGVFTPDRGDLEVHGRVGSLLSVDAGLLWHLTGRENARLLCVLSGCSRAETAESLEDLKARSALEEHFEQPVSTYSQGMRARLGLAAAQQAAPEILLLDEVHEAFDHEHRALLEQRVENLRSGGGIVVASGHDYELLGRLCEHAMLLADGRITLTGSFDEVHDAYLAGLGHE